VLILYDGVCALCNRGVRFLLDRDAKGVFRFAPLQSFVAREVLGRHGIKIGPIETFYAVVDYGLATEYVMSKSSAAVYALGRLGGAWRVAALARWLPWRIRDFAYDIVAHHRYRIFGRYDACPLPDASDRDRFIDVPNHAHPGTQSS
jgi:predicted DCC family thiol-disulfide oxidoreductase YuxK